MNIKEMVQFGLFTRPSSLRFGPIVPALATLGGGSAMAGMGIMASAVGTGMKVSGTLQEGKQAQKIADARAAIDIQNAEAVRRRAVVQAEITAEQGREFTEKQKSLYAAGNIRLGVGAPLVIEAQTKARIAKDVGYILETGRGESQFYRTRADYEKAYGKTQRKRSVWTAISAGIGGFGSIVEMGSDAGWFNKTKTLPSVS